MKRSDSLAPKFGAALLALLLPLLAASALQAQDGSDTEEFDDQVDVTEVLIDVLVTDKKGNVVVGLNEEDFTVEEDGELVDVSDVVFYSNRQLLDPTLASDNIQEGPQQRYFILFFQEQQRNDVPGSVLLQRQLEAARDARQWIKKKILLDDYVAVVSYDVRLKVHADFTNDPAVLIRAVNSAATGKDPGTQWPSRAPETGEISLLYHLPKGNELRDRSETIYDALQTLAKASAPTVGRKNLIMFATGFGDVDELGVYRPDPRYFDPTVQALNDANVAAYTVELAPSNIDYARANGLHQIADETGGTYQFNFTRFLTPLSKIATETSGYYLLSYRSQHPRGETGFQKVKVKTTNESFRVRAREGYLYGD